MGAGRQETRGWRRGPSEVDLEAEELPWDFLYYMATVPFARSEEQFWEMSLRLLVIMIDQHQKVERSRAKAIGFMTACFMNGKDPDEFLEQEDPEKVREKELEMGAMMW